MQVVQVMQETPELMVPAAMPELAALAVLAAAPAFLQEE